MKNLYILIIVLAFSTSSYSQTRSLNKFINHYKVQDNALAVNVPGFVLDLVGLSSKFIDEEDDEARELINLVKKISRIRLLIIDEEANVDPSDIKKLTSNLQNDNFEELLTVRSEGTSVKILIKENRNSIRNITALIQEDNSIFLMTLSGKFKIEDLKNMKMWEKAEINEKVLETL